MREPIAPLLKEDYIPSHLEEEERKREVQPLPLETDDMHWWKRLWLLLKRALTKFMEY